MACQNAADVNDHVIKFKNSNYCDSGAVSLFLSLASISELDSSMHESGSSRKPLISWFLALSASRWIVTRLVSLAMHINTLLHSFHFIPTTCRKSLSVASMWPSETRRTHTRSHVFCTSFLLKKKPMECFPCVQTSWKF